MGEVLIPLAHGTDGEELGWQERALCAQTDPEAFFPEKGGSTREAKKICVGCEVRGECLEYALVNGEKFGTGSTTLVVAGCVTLSFRTFSA